MRKAITYSLLFGCIMLLILCITQHMVDKGLTASKSQYFTVWNDAYQSRINADLLILGGSRARIVISPKVLDSVLHVNSYNLGIDGGFIPIQLAMLKVYLQHNRKPKYILQNVDFSTFSNGIHLSNSEQFIPYISDPIVREMTSHYQEKFTIPELYFPLFKYNNHLNLIKEGLLCYFHTGYRSSNNMYKGFSPRLLAFDNFFAMRIQKESDYLRNNIQPEVDSQFVDYLKFCKSNDIKLIFVYVPLLHDATALTSTDSSAVTRKLLAYAKEYNIPFLSYVNDTLRDHKELFTDHIHLNVTGAQIFNEHLAYDLRTIVAN